MYKNKINNMDKIGSPKALQALSKIVNGSSEDDIMMPSLG
jgi:hypothetical protein